MKVKRLMKHRGVWTVRRRVNGKDTWTSTGYRVDGGKTARNGAERRMHEILNADQSANHGWTPRNQLTFASWWETYRQLRKAATTKARDVSVMNCHALPFFGEMLLGDIRTSECEKYLEMRRASYRARDSHRVPVMIAEGTVQRERRFLQAFMQRAIEDGHKFNNPWKGIERVKDKVRDRVVTLDEQASMMPHLDVEYQRCFQVLLGTGVRIAELRGIDPARHINLETGHLTVTGKGNKTRQVPIHSDLVAVLETQLAECGERLWPQPANTIRGQFKRAAKKADIPHVTPHTMRHTFGHRWLKDGGDIYVLSQILGHASVAITEAHYAHLRKEDLHAAMNARNLGI